LKKFEKKSFDEEVFLSGGIYEEFEKEVLNKESFKEALNYALNDFNGVDKTFFNKTLQKIS